LAAQISAPQIRIGLLNARDGVGDRLRLLAIDTRGLLQDASEGRLSEALLFGKISSSKIRLALRREKHRKRPSTVVAERVRGGLIDLIEIGAFFTINLDVDEKLVHERGRFRIREALLIHNMAPMTGR